MSISTKAMLLLLLLPIVFLVAVLGIIGYMRSRRSKGGSELQLQNTGEGQNELPPLLRFSKYAMLRAECFGFGYYFNLKVVAIMICLNLIAADT
jgi:hypothetical protein